MKPSSCESINGPMEAEAEDESSKGAVNDKQGA